MSGRCFVDNEETVVGIDLFPSFRIVPTIDSFLQISFFQECDDHHPAEWSPMVL